MKYTGPVRVRIEGARDDPRAQVLVAMGRRMLGLIDSTHGKNPKASALTNVWSDEATGSVKVIWTPLVKMCLVHVPALEANVMGEERKEEVSLVTRRRIEPAYLTGLAIQATSEARSEEEPDYFFRLDGKVFNSHVENEYVDGVLKGYTKKGRPAVPVQRNRQFVPTANNIEDAACLMAREQAACFCAHQQKHREDSGTVIGGHRYNRAMGGAPTDSTYDDITTWGTVDQDGRPVFIHSDVLKSCDPNVTPFSLRFWVTSTPNVPADALAGASPDGYLSTSIFIGDSDTPLSNHTCFSLLDISSSGEKILLQRRFETRGGSWPTREASSYAYFPFPHNKPPAEVLDITAPYKTGVIVECVFSVTKVTLGYSLAVEPTVVAGEAVEGTGEGPVSLIEEDKGEYSAAEFYDVVSEAQRIIFEEVDTYKVPRDDPNKEDTVMVASPVLYPDGSSPIPSNYITGVNCYAHQGQSLSAEGVKRIVSAYYKLDTEDGVERVAFCHVHIIGLEQRTHSNDVNLINGGGTVEVNLRTGEIYTFTASFDVSGSYTVESTFTLFSRVLDDGEQVFENVIKSESTVVETPSINHVGLSTKDYFILGGGWTDSEERAVYMSNLNCFKFVRSQSILAQVSLYAYVGSLGGDSEVLKESSTAVDFSSFSYTSGGNVEDTILLNCPGLVKEYVSNCSQYLSYGVNVGTTYAPAITGGGPTTPKKIENNRLVDDYESLSVIGGLSTRWGTSDISSRRTVLVVPRIAGNGGALGLELHVVDHSSGDTVDGHVIHMGGKVSLEGVAQELLHTPVDMRAPEVAGDVFRSNLCCSYNPATKQLAALFPHPVSWLGDWKLAEREADVKQAFQGPSVLTEEVHYYQDIVDILGAE